MAAGLVSSAALWGTLPWSTRLMTRGAGLLWMIKPWDLGRALFSWATPSLYISQVVVVVEGSCWLWSQCFPFSSLPKLGWPLLCSITLWLLYFGLWGGEKKNRVPSNSLPWGQTWREEWVGKTGSVFAEEDWFADSVWIISPLPSARGFLEHSSPQERGEGNLSFL